MKKSSAKSPYCTFYIVRHGQTEWNAKKIIQGHTDTPLTAEGIKQAQSLGRKLKRIHFAGVFSSDLVRAKRTAELIVYEKELAIQTTKALRERYFGWAEGKSWKSRLFQIQKLLYKIESVYLRKILPFRLFEDEERDEALISRFITFLREAAVGYTGKNVLVVTHGGAMRMFLIRLGFLKKHEFVKIANASFIRLRSDGVDFFIDQTEGIESMNKE